MFIRQIVSFLQTHKKLLFFVTFFFGIFLLSGEGVFAEGEAVTEGGIEKEDLDKIVGILNGFITGISALIGMVTAFISMFLYPGWVNGTLFGLQEYLKEIWILISNIVYFIFAFILIAIAFMNIIGKGEGTWELKQAMPKFIVGVLIVPFSWFMVQFILSVSAILTVGVLTLPYDSFQGKDLYQGAIEALGDEKICKDIIITFSNTPGADGGSTAITGSDGEALSENIRCKEDGEIEIQKIFTGEGEGAGLQNSIFGIISVYTYGILQIQEMDTITGKDLESISTVADLIFKIVFDLLFIIIYLLLMVALLLALFVRGIRLWIFAMLSPVFGLLYFFGKTSDGGSTMEKFTPKEFIALALVPVYVSAALAFGMVFIMVASQGIKENHDIMEEDTLNVGGFSLTIEGAHGNGESEKSVIGKLIVEIFGVVILWIAVMAALGASKTTAAIVQPIADFGKSVGDLAAKAPTYAPIIPTGSGQMQSAASLKTIGGSIQSAAAGEQTRRAQSFMDNTGLGGTSGITKLNNAAELAAGNIERFSDDKNKVVEELRRLLQGNDGSLANIRGSEQAQNAIKATAVALEMDSAQVDNLRFDSERHIMDALSAIDRLAPGVGAGDGFFDGTHNDGHVTTESYARWQSGGKIDGADDTLPPAGETTIGDINLTNITVANAEERAESMSGVISERDLRAKLVLADIPDDQHEGIVLAFDAAEKIEE